VLLLEKDISSLSSKSRQISTIPLPNDANIQVKSFTAYVVPRSEFFMIVIQPVVSVANALMQH
jgi:hypothetical protein